MADIVALSREAWNALRSEHQPAYDDLVDSYKEMLHARAQNVVSLRRVTDEGGVFQTFEQNVIELLIPERFHQSIPAEVKQELIKEVVAETKPKKTEKKTTTPAPKSVKKSVKAVKKVKK